MLVFRQKQNSHCLRVYDACIVIGPQQTRLEGLARGCRAQVDSLSVQHQVLVPGLFQQRDEVLGKTR